MGRRDPGQRGGSAGLALRQHAGVRCAAGPALLVPARAVRQRADRAAAGTACRPHPADGTAPAGAQVDRAPGRGHAPAAARGRLCPGWHPGARRIRGRPPCVRLDAAQRLGHTPGVRRAARRRQPAASRACAEVADRARPSLRPGPARRAGERMGDGIEPAGARGGARLPRIRVRSRAGRSRAAAGPLPEAGATRDHPAAGARGRSPGLDPESGAGFVVVLAALAKVGAERPDRSWRGLERG